MRRRGGLMLRGLWWRRGLTAAILAVSTVTITAAALGPLYARAAGESTLNDQLTGASWRAGIHVSGTVDVASADLWPRLERAVPRAGQLHGYDQRIEGVRSAGGVPAALPGASDGLSATVVWREGACAHLVIVSGRCPTGPGEAMFSARSFAAGSAESLYLAPHKWRIGTRLTVGPFTDPFAPSLGGAGTTVQIVGTYRPKDTADPFWFGQNYFNAHPGIGSGKSPPPPPTVDALMVSRPTMLSIGQTAFLDADFDYPLTASAVRLRNENAERAQVSSAIRRPPPHTGLKAESGLGRTLARADSERRLLDIGTLLVTLQLALLAWLVLFQVVADAIEARGNEIAMAKLRGHSPFATLRFGLSEPLALLVMAVPLGILAAWGITHAFDQGVFASGTPVITTSAPVATALLAFAGGVVAAGLAGYRTLTRSVLDQWRRTSRRPGRGWLTLVADVVVAAAAVTALVVLLRHHNPRGSHATGTLLAPGLLVLAVALLGVRLLPLLSRGLARITRSGRRLGLFLASRQVARRPVGLRLAALLAVAVGLATFAVAGESVASTNRRARADAELGADRVASIQYVSSHDPIAATERADPDGRWAMAAATWLPYGGGTVLGTVLGVDSSRLAAVGEPVSGGLNAATLARLVGGGAVPAITTTATRMRVHLTASDLTGETTPLLEVDLRTAREPYVVLQTTTHIHAGSGTYTVKLPCASGCTLRGLTWVRPIDTVRPLSGTIELTGLDLRRGAEWAPVDIRSGVDHSWRAAKPQGQATDHVTLSPSGVRDHFTDRNGGYSGIAYSSDPSPIPAVGAPGALVPGAHPEQVIDGLNVTANIHVVQEPRIVPAELTGGVVMDVRYLQTQLPDFSGEAVWQVWIGAHAPADALARLRAAGLTIDHVRSVNARVTLLSRQGPALALLLLLACAVAGAVLAAGATATSIAANSRRRSYELAALGAVGVDRGARFRASLIEQLLLLGTGAVLGVPTGLIAARIAMPAIPEFSDLTPITLIYTPDLGPALLFTGAFVVLVTATALVAATALNRAALPSRLRAAE